MGRKLVAGFDGMMGKLFIAGTEFCAEDWEVNEVGEESDTTNTCGNGYAEQEIGIKQLEGTINYTWDADRNPYSDVPSLAVGQKHAGTRLYPNTDGDDQNEPHFALTLHILNHRNSIPVRGKVSGVIQFKSHGAYTLPTGSVSDSGA